MDKPIDLNNPTLDNVKLERGRAIQSTFIPPNQPKYNEWFAFIKKECDKGCTFNN
jgi:hypothetical protein